MSKILKISAFAFKRKRFRYLQKASKLFITQFIDKKPQNLSIYSIIRKIPFSNFTLPNVSIFWNKYAKLYEIFSFKELNLRINSNVPILLGNHQNYGSSNVIFPVKNYNFANKLVVKQPFKYDIEYEIPSSELVESEIYKKIGNHRNITRYVRDVVCDLSNNNDNYRKDFPDVCYSGKINSILLEKMDYNLEDMLRNRGGELTEKDRCDILAQVCEAEHHLYNRNIAHRDLKLNNILVNVNENCRKYFRFAPKFIAKLSDFDCAIDVSDSKNGDTVAISGAPICQPPEIMIQTDPNNIKRQKYERADLWALGCLCYELFGSINPFSDNKGLSRTQYCNSQLPTIPSAPVVINKLAHKLLSYQPTERYMASICADIINLHTLSSIIKHQLIVDYKALFLSSQLCQMDFTAIRLIYNSMRRSFVMDFVLESHLEDVE